MIISGLLKAFMVHSILILVLILFVFQCANAETPAQPDQDGVMQKIEEPSPETNTPGTPSITADEQQKAETGPAPQPEAKTAAPEAPGPQSDPCAAAEVSGETWLDQTHDYVNRKLCQPAVWFDDFFGDDRVLENVRPTLLINLRNSVRWTEGQGFDLINDYRLQYRLPQMQKMLRKAKLSIVVGSPADKSATQPGQSVDPGADPATGGSGPTIFRYIERFSETSQLDLERKITTFTLLRWSNFATYAEGTAGITWNSGISLITQLTPRSAITYDTSIWGVNRPEWTIQNYRVGSRYRRNFYRPWLFFELAPEVTWPIDESNHRNATFAFMATLEVQFGR